MGAGTQMVQLHEPLRIDQDVAAELPPIASRLSGHLTPFHPNQVFPDRFRSVDLPPTSSLHSIGAIKRLVGILN